MFQHFQSKSSPSYLNSLWKKKQEEHTKLAPVSPSKHNSSKFYSLSFCNQLPLSLVEGTSSPLPLQNRQVPFGCYTSHQEAMDSATYQQNQTKAAIDTHDHTKKWEKLNTDSYRIDEGIEQGCRKWLTWEVYWTTSCCPRELFLCTSPVP